MVVESLALSAELSAVLSLAVELSSLAAELSSLVAELSPLSAELSALVSDEVSLAVLDTLLVVELVFEVKAKFPLYITNMFTTKVATKNITAATLVSLASLASLDRPELR